MDDLQKALDAIARATSAAAPLVGGTAGSVLQIASTVFQSAAAIAQSGRDPVAEIARIHAADPLVASVKEEWQAAIDAKFGKG